MPTDKHAIKVYLDPKVWEQVQARVGKQGFSAWVNKLIEDELGTERYIGRGQYERGQHQYKRGQIVLYQGREVRIKSLLHREYDYRVTNADNPDWHWSRRDSWLVHEHELSET